MTASGSNSLAAVGFLSVRQFTDLGLIGGYLILNFLGRPLEFHCTAPVRPNRAQEILYGPTLEPYVCGEQIAATLIEKGRSEPLFVCTDKESVLAAREFVSVPLVYLQVDRSEEPGGQGATPRIDARHAWPPSSKFKRLAGFELAGCQAAVWESHLADRDDLLNRWRQAGGDLDLQEPFGRLHEAIEEAQSGATRQGER